MNRRRRCDDPKWCIEECRRCDVAMSGRRGPFERRQIATNNGCGDSIKTPFTVNYFEIIIPELVEL